MSLFAIGSAGVPTVVDDASPFVGQSSLGNAGGFTLGELRIVKRFGPRAVFDRQTGVFEKRLHHKSRRRPPSMDIAGFATLLCQRCDAKRRCSRVMVLGK